MTNPARPIYLDYQASTPCDARVIEVMVPFFGERFGNPNSVQHRQGREAEAAVDRARGQIAELIGAEAREIVFTSGATEANNLAIKGAARFLKSRRPHFVSCVTEHKCVLESGRRLESEGVRVTWLPVGSDGLIDPDRLAGAMGEDTALVSIMAVNNEIGAIQPIAQIGALCRERGVLFHTDAAQAAGKIPIDVEAMKIDLLSISGHKMYGPMGIGALYVRRRPRVRLEPLFDGGGQERGMRSGTLPGPLCVGLGAACEIAQREMTAEAQRLTILRDRLLDTLTTRLPDVRVNGATNRRVPGNLNLSFAGIDAEALMQAMPGLSVSTGSACTSTSVEPSYVLRALGLSDAAARGAVRFGLGRPTTESEIDAAAEMIVAAVLRQRAGAAAVAE